ncbi:hypothetical protein BDV39DRAFT_188379 [Aspergillus sergii]|uniref:NAD-dependent epimerase/dehydratase domain-containing protein n=1 Tax=Aspergillus sergii TaxID=1034303 RepID=A0A5N6XPL8_9EURO|nr:hypothetical protein BDV39DRAFT_188379 [Aspergillus sergii]
MARELIFITGATGFVGSATVIAVVKGGYRLRICLRKHPDRLQALLSDYSEQYEALFKGHLNGVDYVIYLAHPLPDGTDKEYYFTPAVKLTTVLLKEAARVPSIKKVVITSSIAALMPLDGIPPEFRKAAKSQFILVTRHPVFVYGCNPTQTAAKEIEESSNAHIKALDLAIPDESRYLLSGKGGNWTERIEEEFLSTDSGKAEAELGMQWRSWDRMVRDDVVDQQLEFKKGE